MKKIIELSRIEIDGLVRRAICETGECGNPKAIAIEWVITGREDMPIGAAKLDGVRCEIALTPKDGE